MRLKNISRSIPQTLSLKEIEIKKLFRIFVMQLQKLIIDNPTSASC